MIIIMNFLHLFYYYIILYINKFTFRFLCFTKSIFTIINKYKVIYIHKYTYDWGDAVIAVFFFVSLNFVGVIWLSPFGNSRSDFLQIYLNVRCALTLRKELTIIIIDKTDECLSCH